MATIDKGRGAIFDWDGVLVDTGEYHRLAWHDLAQREGFKLTDEFFYNTFGMQNYQIIPLLLGREVAQDELNRMSVWKEQRFRELIAGKLTLMEGAKALLIDLKGKGFRLAVGSSAPKINLMFMLEAAGAKEYFDAFVWGEDVCNGKPAPDTFLKAAEKLAISPQCCVVVEDALQGVQAAQAAGMAVIAITTTRSRQDLQQADIIVDSLNEINSGVFIKLLTAKNNCCPIK